MNSIFIKIGDTGVVLSKRCNETAFVWIDRCGERYVKRMVGLDTNKIVAVVAKLNLPKNLVVGNTNNENGICHIESDIEFADGEACFQEVYKNGEWHLKLAHEKVKVKDDGRKNTINRKMEEDGLSNGL